MWDVPVYMSVWNVGFVLLAFSYFTGVTGQAGSGFRRTTWAVPKYGKVDTFDSTSGLASCEKMHILAEGRESYVKARQRSKNTRGESFDDFFG